MSKGVATIEKCTVSEFVELLSAKDTKTRKQFDVNCKTLTTLDTFENDKGTWVVKQIGLITKSRLISTKEILVYSMSFLFVNDDDDCQIICSLYLKI